MFPCLEIHIVRTKYCCGKAMFTRTCDCVTHAIKNREHFCVTCAALFIRTCVNFW